jgi:hypothetical protein
VYFKELKRRKFVGYLNSKYATNHQLSRIFPATYAIDVLIITGEH